MLRRTVCSEPFDAASHRAKRTRRTWWHHVMHVFARNGVLYRVMHFTDRTAPAVE